MDIDSNILNNEFDTISCAKDRIDKKFSGFGEGALGGVVEGLGVCRKNLEGFVGFMISYREEI